MPARHQLAIAEKELVRLRRVEAAAAAYREAFNAADAAWAGYTALNSRVWYAARRGADRRLDQSQDVLFAALDGIPRPVGAEVADGG